MALTRKTSLETRAVRASQAFQSAQDLMAAAADQLIRVKDGLQSEAEEAELVASDALTKANRLRDTRAKISLNHAPDEVRGLFANL